MKILTIVDKYGTAIDRLAQKNKEYNSHLQNEILAVHPKRPDQKDLDKFLELAEWADILDFQYYKTALMLLEKFPQFKNKKKILAHHNPYSLFENDWNDFDVLVVNNTTMSCKLPRAELIHLATDPNFFRFNEEYTEEKTVNMVAGRIEGKKGILPVAEVCAELGYKLILVGKISDGEYFNQIIRTNCVEFHENVTDEELRDCYYKSAIHVCNSVDNFESGTMPILEAMQCGVPVLTRMVGHVPDLFTGDNMFVRYGNPEDKEELKYVLKNIMEDKEKRLKVRENGWKTARLWNSELRARQYDKLYHKVLYGDNPIVSIICAIFNRKELLQEYLEAIKNQSYKNIELIICDDGSTDGTHDWIMKNRFNYNFPIKYLNTFNTEGYGLAMARNMGIVEAIGDILVICDSRLKMDKYAVENFVKNILPKTFLYGNKGTEKRSFVENFSACLRQDLINAGMFCERIDAYGGMTQEIYYRLKKQGWRFQQILEAKAEPMISSKAKFKKRNDITKIKTRLVKMGLYEKI